MKRARFTEQQIIGLPRADASAPSFFRGSWSAPRKPSMGNVPRKLPALHRFSKITPLGHLETQFPDRQEIGSCFRPFRDRSCPAFGQFQNPPAGRALKPVACAPIDKFSINL
jgi:hypothetical protein